ncbi:CBFD_NFYB_HMF domain-containing protein [Cinnamomum micranthum f. kanehirae]|uniref:CBFD_NFYB_HMF domain-containing protein n=1 Tax=Cinnamomum micranthum f. kanehirae TaxID=337451 RepID=A0A3S3ND69_9MAGN|nr:CBFD_NFYB_HMF domain-containing protein [Cinnamomum micranthum f. kanehirae]
MEDESHVHGPIRGSPESSPHSDNNKNSNAKNIGNSSSSNNRDQDRFLPIANVGRIMKKAIPSNGKVSKDAKETVQECVSEFISFVTGEASDKCQREKRKTINGDDLIWAITTLGFDDYVNPLKLYLLKYKELEGEKLTIPKQHHQEQAPPTPQQQQQQHQHHNMVQLDSSQHSLLYANQPFSMPFSPQQQQNDPRGRW